MIQIERVYNYSIRKVISDVHGIYDLFHRCRFIAFLDILWYNMSTFIEEIVSIFMYDLKILFNSIKYISFIDGGK